MLEVDTGTDHSLSVDVFLARGSQPTPLALLTAGVHGDEYEGPDALATIARMLPEEDLLGSVIVLPVANPMAFTEARRLTPIDGKNLARCFPGCRDSSPTERLAHAIFESFVRPSTHVIDLHSGGVDYIFAPVAGFYGSPRGQEASYDAARRFGLDRLWQLPETKGVLSCEAWKLGKTSIGCEYLGAGQLSSEGSEAYVRGICPVWRIGASCAVASFYRRTGSPTRMTGSSLTPMAYFIHRPRSEPMFERGSCSRRKRLSW